MRAEKPVELTQAQWEAWPWCAIQACGNKCCLRLNSIYCWPHTKGLDNDEVMASLEDEDEDNETEDTNVEDSHAR